MGRHHAKHIRNIKVADILRKKNSVSYPSISSKIPTSGDFQRCEVTGYANYHMGKQDLIKVSSISIPTGLNQNCEIFSENLMKVNADGVSSGNLIPSFASTDEHRDDFKSVVAGSSDLASLKNFDPFVKPPAAAVHPAAHVSDNLHSVSPKSSANASHKAVKPGYWVDLFKKNRTFSENCGRLTEIKLSDNFVDLRGSLRNDVADLCLLGSFSSSFPGKDAILKLRNSWNVSCHVHFHVSKWVIFKFENFIDLDMVLRGGPYCFFGKPMRLFKMPRFFNFSSDLFSVICVWVKFPNLPLNLWNDDDLSSICSYLGKPLYTDLLTKQRLNLDYARCLIEIDVSQNLNKLIPILLADGTVLHQPVMYEDLPVSCTINDSSCEATVDVFHNVRVKSELVNEMVNKCEGKNDVVHEVVSDVSMVCGPKPECFRFGSLDFEEAIESITCSKGVVVEVVDMVAVKSSVKNDKESDGMKADVFEVSNGAAVLNCDNDDDVLNMVEIGCESICVHLDDVLIVENSEFLGDKWNEKPVEVEEVVDDCFAVDSDVRLGDNLGGEDLVDHVVLEDEFVDGDLQADLVVGCDGDNNSAFDDDKEVDDVDVESDFVDDSASTAEIAEDVDVVKDENLSHFTVFVKLDATFEEQIAACKRAGMRGWLFSLGGKSLNVDLNLYDDSGRLLKNSVEGVAADGFDESDDDDSAVVNESEFDEVSASFSGDVDLVNVRGEGVVLTEVDIDESDEDDYDSNEVDDNDDDFEASDVDSHEDIEVNAENSRNFLHNYTLKVLKEAEDGGYIKCNARPKPEARGKAIFLTEDDIDMDLYNEGIRLGKY